MEGYTEHSTVPDLRRRKLLSSIISAQRRLSSELEEKFEVHIFFPQAQKVFNDMDVTNLNNLGNRMELMDQQTSSVVSKLDNLTDSFKTLKRRCADELHLEGIVPPLEQNADQRKYEQRHDEDSIKAESTDSDETLVIKRHPKVKTKKTIRRKKKHQVSSESESEYEINLASLPRPSARPKRSLKPTEFFGTNVAVKRSWFQ